MVRPASFHQFQQTVPALREIRRCVYFLWRWDCVLFKRMRYESRDLLRDVAHRPCDMKESSNFASVPRWLEVTAGYFPPLGCKFWKRRTGPCVLCFDIARPGSSQGWEACKTGRVQRNPTCSETGCVQRIPPVPNCKEELIIMENQWSREAFGFSKASD